jgi:hypothetical protein
MNKSMNEPPSIWDADELAYFGRTLKRLLEDATTMIDYHPPSRNTDTTAEEKMLQPGEDEGIKILTNCLPSAFLMTSDGTPLNWRRGVIEPHLSIIYLACSLRPTKQAERTCASRPSYTNQEQLLQEPPNLASSKSRTWHEGS